MPKMLRHDSLLALSVLWILCQSPEVFAQTSGNGSIRGQVRDQQGATLTGATIVAESENTPIPVRATTDDHGFYRLLDLPPGEYKLIAEYSGFASTTVAPVIVRFGLNLNVDVKLSIGTQAETVTVTTPMIEARSAVNAFNLSGDLQRAIPLSSRKNWSDFLSVTPGVTSLQISNQSVGSVDAYSLRGSGSGSHVIQIDGADMASADLGAPNNIGLSTEAIADVQVTIGAAGVSSPLGQGAVVNVATKSGTNHLRGALSFSMQRRAWTSSNSPGGTSQAVDGVQPEAALGGPLIRDRLWLFAAYQYYRTNASVARSALQLATLQALDQTFEPFDAIGHGHFLFTKGSAQVSQAHRIELSHRYDPITNQSTNANALAIGQVIRSGSSGNISFRMSSIWANGLVTSFGASSNNTTSYLESIVDTASMPVASRVRLSSGRLIPDNTVANLSGAGRDFVNARHKSTLHGDLAFGVSSRFGEHQIRAGVDYQPRNIAKTSIRMPSDGIAQISYVLIDPSDLTRGVQPYRQTIYDRLRYESSSDNTSDFAIYVQDSWRLQQRITVDGGVRLDRIRRNDVLFGVATQRSVDIGPRIGVNYAATRSGHDIIRASWSRVHDAVSIGATSVGTISPGVTDLYDTNLDGVFETAFVTPPVTALVANRIVDRERSQPVMDEWALGYRRANQGGLTLDAGLVRRAYKRMLTSVEINRLYENGQFKGYIDPAFSELYQFTNNRWNWPVYYGLEAQVVKESSGVKVIGSYTRSFRKLEGQWIPNEVDSFIQFDKFPNDKSLGDTFAWQDHLVRIGAIYSAPWELLAAVNYAFQSGGYSGPILTNLDAPDLQFGPPVVTLPDGRVVSNPLATIQRYAYETRGDGQLKLPSLHVLSVRVGRVMPLWNGARLEVTADAYNVTNHGSDTAFLGGATLLQGASYGLTAARQQPRTMRLSARVSF